MSTLIKARGLRKTYGKFEALAGVDFDIEEGCIVGLIGPNGAGKTTALKSILGLSSFEGDLEVMGRDPRRERKQIMNDVCFIADVAVLPRWIRVNQVIDFVEAVHPKFNRATALEFLSHTEIKLRKKVGQLSKGMITQLHLALVMSIDAKLLVLDEPTLGLDILFRKEFYSNLLNDYFDEKRTILVTTHQVEEIEKILTHLIFIKNGKFILNDTMEAVAERYTEVLVSPDQVAAARDLNPIHETEIFGKQLFLFDGATREQLSAVGELHRPSVADLFVAKMKGATA